MVYRGYCAACPCARLVVYLIEGNSWVKIGDSIIFLNPRLRREYAYAFGGRRQFEDGKERQGI